MDKILESKELTIPLIRSLGLTLNKYSYEAFFNHYY